MRPINVNRDIFNNKNNGQNGDRCWNNKKNPQFIRTQMGKPSERSTDEGEREMRQN